MMVFVVGLVMRESKKVMNKLVLIFTILTVINVVFSTIKSILTISGNKWIASAISAFYYGYYNIVLIYTVADFPMWQKVTVTALCNLVGVFLVKWGEEKARPSKLWKIEATIPVKNFDKLSENLKLCNIPYNYVNIEKYFIFNIYCATPSDSKKTKKALKEVNAKYFISESKNF